MPGFPIDGHIFGVRIIATDTLHTSPILSLISILHPFLSVDDRDHSNSPMIS